MNGAPGGWGECEAGRKGRESSSWGAEEAQPQSAGLPGPAPYGQEAPTPSLAGELGRGRFGAVSHELWGWVVIAQ